MDSQKLHSILRQANFIGQNKGVYVAYKKKIGHSFHFRFFRHGKFIGSTQLPDQVISRMIKYCAGG